MIDTEVNGNDGAILRVPGTGLGANSDGRFQVCDRKDAGLTDRARGFIRSPTAVKPCTRPIFSKLNYCLDGGVCKEGFVDILALTKRRLQAFAATMRVMPTNTVGTTNLFRSGIGIPK